jgi:hypothetical protein
VDDFRADKKGCEKTLLPLILQNKKPPEVTLSAT